MLFRFLTTGDCKTEPTGQASNQSYPSTSTPPASTDQSQGDVGLANRASHQSERSSATNRAIDQSACAGASREECGDSLACIKLTDQSEQITAKSQANDLKLEAKLPLKTVKQGKIYLRTCTFILSVEF